MPARTLILLAVLAAGPLVPPAQADNSLATLGIIVDVIPDAPAPAPPAPAAARPGDALPDGRPGFGAHDIAVAWLIAPTTRYAHGVLGDALEAAGLRVVLRDGRALEVLLDPESVFEDLRPRLADLDGDRRDEVIVVRSYLDRGAALAVYHVAGEALVPVAETAPIGRSNRWLNPVGVGDFDGDGAPEVAYVETPHIGGVLRVVSLHDGRLVEEAAERGFSNHAVGSRALGLSAILDLDGDGSDELLIPADGRRALRLVSLAGGRFRDLGLLAHDSPIVTDFALADRDGNGRPDVAYGLADGSLVVLRP